VLSPGIGNCREWIFSIRAAQALYSGIFEIGRRRLCQLIHGQLFTPMIRNKDRVRPDCSHHQHRKIPHRDVKQPNALSPSLIFGIVSSRSPMDFDIRLEHCLDQKTNAPRLIARKILIDDLVHW